MSSVSPKQLAEYKEAFALFDRTGEGKIPMTSVGTLLRALGRNPTETELKEMITDETATINFDEFLKLLEASESFSANSEASVKEFIQAFQVFDRDGSGFISAGELRYVLTSLGDRLTDAEVDDLLKGIETDAQDNINYQELVKTLTSI
ncbi:hypothetical protein BB561_001035 [Smittium simulii]|uniref:EF-hand domain-containing protein n=1 Tax=Smittium simulii TaxID=133385 RepID=A0A2T9YWF7_9FUNG|nr:hypothetical protein BB561_001035 [Smittium simulii]